MESVGCKIQRWNAKTYLRKQSVSNRILKDICYEYKKCTSQNHPKYGDSMNRMISTIRGCIQMYTIPKRNRYHGTSIGMLHPVLCSKKIFLSKSTEYNCLPTSGARRQTGCMKYFVRKIFLPTLSTLGSIGNHNSRAEVSTRSPAPHMGAGPSPTYL